jgi:hypothetical protein
MSVQRSEYLFAQVLYICAYSDLFAITTEDFRLPQITNVVETPKEENPLLIIRPVDLGSSFLRSLLCTSTQLKHFQLVLTSQKSIFFGKNAKI